MWNDGKSADDETGEFVLHDSLFNHYDFVKDLLGAQDPNRFADLPDLFGIYQHYDKLVERKRRKELVSEML